MNSNRNEKKIFEKLKMGRNSSYDKTQIVRKRKL